MSTLHFSNLGGGFLRKTVPDASSRPSLSQTGRIIVRSSSTREKEGFFFVFPIFFSVSFFAQRYLFLPAHTSTTPADDTLIISKPQGCVWWIYIAQPFACCVTATPSRTRQNQHEFRDTATIPDNIVPTFTLSPVCTLCCAQTSLRSCNTASARLCRYT